MSVIEERYILIDREGRELGLITLTTELHGRGLVSSGLEFYPVGPETLPEGKYRLDFVQQGTRPRTLSAPAFEGITSQQGQIVNDRRPSLRVIDGGQQPEGRA